MAKQVLTAAYLALGGTDVSSYVTNIQITPTVNAVDQTTYGSGGTKINGAGLKDWTLSFTAINDYAAGALDSILWPLFGTTFTVEVRASNAVVGTSNPKYTGTGLMTSYPAVSGSVGENATAQVQIVAASALARATS